MSLLGGIRPPIAALSALLLALAGTTALTLGSVEDEPLPEAVLTSQQHIAEDAAVSLRSSLDETVTDLRRVTGHLSSGRPVDADTVLDSIGDTNQRRRGMAVLGLDSGKLLAARGETVPLSAIDPEKLSAEGELKPALVRLASGQDRLLSFGLLSWRGEEPQIAVTSSSLGLPGSFSGSDPDTRTLAVADSSGELVGSGRRSPAPDGQGSRADAPRARQASHPTSGSASPSRTELSDEQLEGFARQAVSRAEDDAPKESRVAVGFPGPSGHLVGDHTGTGRSVAGWAQLSAPPNGPASPTGGLGLTVVAMTSVGETAASSTDPLYGLTAAAALIGIGALTVWLLVGLVQRPLLQLFVESRRLARGDLQRPVSVPRFGETARVGAVLERLRLQLRGEPSRRQERRPVRRRRVGVRGLLVLCGVLMAVWSAPLAMLVNRAGHDQIPSQLVSDQQDRTGTVGDRVRRALNEGHFDLVSVARLAGGDTTARQWGPLLERTLHEHQRYESLYVLDEDGRTVAQAGGRPRHPEGEAPGEKPLSVLGSGGKVPVLAGYAPVPGSGGHTVVGEFRVQHLNALLDQPGLGQVRLVDEESRVIGGNAGFVAFRKLDDSRLAPLLAQTGKSAPRMAGGTYGDDGTRTLAAAAPVRGGGPADDLRWTAVSWQSPDGLALPAYKLQNRTVLVGLLGITATVACLAWLHIVVARPLRELVDRAEALADGDRRTVLYPRHLDEVGAVTRSLELIRQELSEQHKRDGAVPVPAGRN